MSGAASRIGAARIIPHLCHLLLGVFVNTEPRRLAFAGWALVVLVAILMLVLRGSEEAGPAVVFAAIAVGVSAWLWFRESRAALIVSLALGVLWLLQFVAYTIADVVGDDFEVGIFVTDLIAVAAGVAIIWGSWRALRGRTREAIA